MKGKIVITLDEKGAHIQTDLQDMAKWDEVFLVHALGKSLGLEYDDYVVLSLAELEGVLDGVAPKLITVDTKELLKQLKEENQDAC